MNRKSFRGAIFIYFIIIFVLFTFAILSFQYPREKKYRIAQLENTLDNITEITRRFIEQNNLVENNEIKRITDLTKIMPQPNIRITLIDKNGKVIYDSFVNDYPGMENHMDRPEISESAKDEKGSNIRHSETTGEDYFYYAKKYPHYFIRTAIVYDVRIQNFLKAERTFIFFISAIFSIIGRLHQS